MYGITLPPNPHRRAPATRAAAPAAPAPEKGQPWRPTELSPNQATDVECVFFDDVFRDRADRVEIHLESGRFRADHVASGWGHLPSAKHDKVWQGETPLHMAIDNGCEKVVRLLVQSPLIDVNAKVGRPSKQDPELPLFMVKDMNDERTAPELVSAMMYRMWRAVGSGWQPLDMNVEPHLGMTMLDVQILSAQEPGVAMALMRAGCVSRRMRNTKRSNNPFEAERMRGSIVPRVTTLQLIYELKGRQLAGKPANKWLTLSMICGIHEALVDHKAWRKAGGR